MNEQTSDNYLDYAKMTYLTPENCVFYRTEGGFTAMKAFLPPERDDLENGEEAAPEWRDFGRIHLHRAFPFDAPDEFISVMSRDGAEYGTIRNLSDFAGEPEMEAALREELERKYLVRTITRIRSLKEKLGFSYWDVDTDHGRFSFTMQDTYRNLIHNTENGVILTDVDGNRYAIADVLELDPKSYRKIELYL